MPESVRQVCASALEFVTNEPREQALLTSGADNSKGISSSPALLYAALEHQLSRAQVSVTSFIPKLSVKISHIKHQDKKVNIFHIMGYLIMVNFTTHVIRQIL